MKMKISLYSLMTVAPLGLLLWAGTVMSTAQSMEEGTDGRTLSMPRQCQPGRTAPAVQDWRWRPGMKVTIYYLKGDFSLRAQGALTRAIDNWNEALREIDSQITFLVGGESSGLMPVRTDITVMRGKPMGKENVGHVNLHSNSNGRVHLVIVVHPSLSEPDALTSLMTHELGHTVGLADCYKCQPGTTAMAAFRNNSRGNYVYRPSECDLYVVAAGYAGQAITQAGR